MKVGRKSIYALAIWAFLFHFAWEMAQAPAFAEMAGLAFVEASKQCLRAALGDVVIMLVAYALLIFSGRRTLEHFGKLDMFYFSAISFALSALVERLSLAIGRWSYVAEMPVVPGVEIGLVPFAQWLIVPILAIALARRSVRDRP